MVIGQAPARSKRRIHNAPKKNPARAKGKNPWTKKRPVAFSAKRANKKGRV